MTPAAIIKQASADGVNLALSPAGTIKATGEGAAVNRWIPILREHKPEIVAALQEAANAPDVFDFNPPGDPANDDEALQERAGNMTCKAIDDLREFFVERAGIFEFEAKLPQREAEREAGKAAYLLARTRGYSWIVLRAALPPALARDLPSGPGAVYGTPPWGLPRWTLTPAGQPVQQGAFRIEPLQ